MDERGLEILKMRFIDKRSLQSIGEALNLTRQRVHQIIDSFLEKLFYEVELSKWKVENQLNNYDEKMLTFIYLLGPENKDKIIRLLNYWKINQPDEFLEHQLPKLMLKGMGNVMVLKIKRALLLMSIPYDSDDIITIDEKLQKKGIGSGYRFKILQRDNFCCQYCGRSPRKDQHTILHVDHIIPLSKGGGWEDENLITSCQECNIGKSSH
jgi:predicted DNA-binding protein YlxM (UPF0122 family)